MEHNNIQYEQNFKQKCEYNCFLFPKEVFPCKFIGSDHLQSSFSLKCTDALMGESLRRQDKSLRCSEMVPSFHSGLMGLGKRNNGFLLEISWAGLGSGPAYPPRGTWKRDTLERCEHTWCAWKRLQPIAYGRKRQKTSAPDKGQWDKVVILGFILRPSP